MRTAHYALLFALALTLAACGAEDIPTPAPADEEVAPEAEAAPDEPLLEQEPEAAQAPSDD
jgi:hypothetical protein